MRDNLDHGNGLTHSLNTILKVGVMRFTVCRVLGKALLEGHHGRKPGTELIIILKSGSFSSSNWNNIIISTDSERRPMYVDMIEKGEVSDQLVEVT